VEAALEVHPADHHHQQKPFCSKTPLKPGRRHDDAVGFQFADVSMKVSRRIAA
jgi:hypothetical protein